MLDVVQQPLACQVGEGTELVLEAKFLAVLANERFQSGHRWGDSGEGTTHEAPAPLREVFEVS
ncbi:hypothetical protein, partial [Streptomyces sp. NPDC029526]|uniref:hypothetical protein n=1 Tax=Streptomyces sp. NPDC029526 TaxID=3155728 RepID=UPI0033F6CCAD